MDTTKIAATFGDRWSGFGDLGLEGKASQSAPSVFNTFLSSAIGLLTVIAGIYFIFLFMFGAIGMMSAGGDKAAMESARKKISTGLLGLVIVISAIFVISLLGYLLGLDILNPFGALFGDGNYIGDPPINVI
jgi:hypothetical protein